MFSKRQNPERVSNPIHIYFSFGDSGHSGCTWSKIQKKMNRTGHSFCGPGVVRCVLLHVMSRLEFTAESSTLGLTLASVSSPQLRERNCFHSEMKRLYFSSCCLLI